MSAVPRTAAPPEVLTEDLRRRIDREVAKFPADKKQSAVMAALAIAQEEIGWVSPEVIDDVARYLEYAADRRLRGRDASTACTTTEPVGASRSASAPVCRARCATAQRPAST